MNYSKIIKFDTANGPGIRTTLFVSGCGHHCRNCHNPETWNPNAGQPYTKEIEDSIIESLKPEYISGLTISGGDPLYGMNMDYISYLARRVRVTYPHKSIWLYTGYSWVDIIIEMEAADDDSVLYRLLKSIDVLVDGKYIEEKSDISLPYCGSSNQRVIDVQASLARDNIILYKG